MQNANSVTGSFKQQGEPNDSILNLNEAHFPEGAIVSTGSRFTQYFRLYYLNRAITSWLSWPVVLNKLLPYSFLVLFYDMGHTAYLLSDNQTLFVECVIATWDNTWLWWGSVFRDVFACDMTGWGRKAGSWDADKAQIQTAVWKLEWQNLLIPAGVIPEQTTSA